MDIATRITGCRAILNRRWPAPGKAVVVAALALGCWAWPLPGRMLAADTPQRLNIVFVLADDLGWADLGCYGSQFYESAHIDALAAEGMRFSQAYSAGSVCSPTRSSIQTGKYPARTGVTDYIPGLHPAGAALDTPYTRRELPLEETTVAEALGKHGYQTFYSGKWHLGGAGFEPQDQGYEVVISDASLGSSNKDPLVGDRITESALRFLDSRDTNRPFFMFLGYHEPHTPLLAHPKYINRFEAKAAQTPKPPRESIAERKGQSRVVQNVPAYATEVAVLDDSVKRLSEKLDTLGLTATTLFVFTSDNGGLCTKAEPGPTSNLPLRSGKGWLYEGGTRVPLIVRLPGVVRPGSLCDTPVISTDYFPTLLALAGAPPLPRQHVDGLSLVPLLSGGTLPARALYWHYPHYHGSTWAPGSAIRAGDWKLIEFFEERKVELYHLGRDLGERSDLAATMPDLAAQLKAQLGEWRSALGAAIPQPAHAGKADARSPSRVNRKRARGVGKSAGRNDK